MSLKIEKIEFNSSVGVGKVNEDSCGYKDNTFWVLDGATGLNKRNFTDDVSDAHWYSSWWDSYLQENVRQEKSIEEMMLDGIDKIRNAYKLYCGDSVLEKIDLPSASITLVRLVDDELEYFILGDCKLYVDYGEKLEIIHDDSVSKLDEQVFNAMLSIENFYSLDLHESLSQVSDQIISNRMKNNTSDGYWILSFDENAVKNAKKGKIKIDENTRFMIASDGYYSYSDKYKLVDERLLLDATFKNGIEKIVESLRNFESDSEKIRKIPRFKDKDDCTCLCVSLVRKR